MNDSTNTTGTILYLKSVLKIFQNEQQPRKMIANIATKKQENEDEKNVVVGAKLV